MAYFRKRGKGWSFTIDIGRDPVTGERKQKVQSGFSTKKEAQIAAAKIEQELAEGSYTNEKNITFEDFAPQWLHMYESTGKVKPTTIKIRTVCVKRLKKHFVKIRLKDITRKMYQDMLLSLKEAKYAKETIVSTHATAKLLFSKAVELGIIKSDPTSFAIIPTDLPTVEEIENAAEIPKFLEKEQLALFLKTCSTHGHDKDYIMFLTLAYTGIRIGELCALKWSDIDFEEKTISITKTYWNPTNNTQKYVIGTPKTKTSRRVIDVDQKLVNELIKHKSIQNKLRLQYRNVYHDKGFVFSKMKDFYGYPEKPKVIEDRMKRLLRIAQLDEKLTPHSLRHTHTSLLAEAGVELTQIMERLGHKNDIITRSVYLHVTKTMRREASERFSRLMDSL